MLRLTLRGLVHHRLRLVATVIAVMLGVSFVAGTYVLTDTIQASLSGLIDQGSHDVAVVVQARSAVTGGNAAFTSSPPISQATLARVRSIPGVAAADGQVVGFAELVHPDGKAVGSPFAPTFGFSVGTVPSLRSLTLRSGRFPTADDEIAVDAGTAQSQHYHLGSTVEVAGAQPVRKFTVVGTVGYGSANNLAGATIVGFDLATAQAVTGNVGRLQYVLVGSDGSVSDAALAKRIAGVLGPTYQVQTGAQFQAQSSTNLSNGFGFLTTALLIFAGVALFVGAFIIFNTFSIIVAQRSRELALLRCLGAFRRQLLTMVLAESAIIGLVSSVLGLGLGIVLAVGLHALLGSVGVDLPSTSPQLLPRTVVVSLVLGVVVTIAAATLPAVRAGRASPLAALRDDPGSDDGSSTRFRLVVGTLLAVVGVVAVVDGLFGRGGNRGQISGVGVAAVFLAVSAFGPVIARPLAGANGRPFAAAFKLPGRLARENAMRHPRRTASTAAALMIGLALVTIVAVFSQTIKTSLATALDDGLTAQGVVSPTNIASSGFTTAVAATLAADRHFTDVTGLAQGAATLEGAGPRGGGGGHLTAKRLEHGHLLGGGSPKGPARVHVLGVDVPAYVNDIRLSVKAGSLAHLGTGDVAVSSAFASSHHLAVGDGVTLTFPTSGTRRLRIGAVFVDPTTVSGDLLVTTATFDQVYPITQLDEAVILRWAPGLSDAQGTTALTRALKPFPQVKGQDRAGYIASQQQSLDQLVALVTALLALAIVIALFGIVNTLALSILERTREIGLLRILGMSRRQLRSMVRWESVVIALLGCVLGMVIGLGFGWVLVRSLRSQGLTQFAVPWSLLAVVVVLAGLAGVVAAVLPAHRAVRIDVLEAIAAD